MRTTLSVDDDVLLAARERAGREGRTVGAIVSELAREALTGRTGPSTDPADERNGFRPLPRRGPAVSNALIDRLREEAPE